jgi:hypothetical protein
MQAHTRRAWPPAALPLAMLILSLTPVAALAAPVSVNSPIVSAGSVTLTATNGDGIFLGANVTSTLDRLRSAAR